MTLTTRAMALLMFNLRHGPAPYEDLVAYGEREFGIPRETIDGEADRLGITRYILHGETYLVRPANLFAIWWGNRPAHYYERQRQSAGGTA